MYFKYNNWFADGSGEYKVGIMIMKVVLEKYLLLKGVPVNSLEAVDQALKAKYGRACEDWRDIKKKYY